MIGESSHARETAGHRSGLDVERSLPTTNPIGQSVGGLGDSTIIMLNGE